MNLKTATAIREACAKVTADGVRIARGPWFEWTGGRAVSCCPIGAVLLARGRVTAPSLSVTPGYVRAACEELGEDPTWLWRFWMGFDRGYQVMVVREEKGKPPSESRDDVSSFGIQLSKELI